MQEEHWERGAVRERVDALLASADGVVTLEGVRSRTRMPQPYDLPAKETIKLVHAATLGLAHVFSLLPSSAGAARLRPGIQLWGGLHACLFCSVRMRSALYAAVCQQHASLPGAHLLARGETLHAADVQPLRHQQQWMMCWCHAGRAGCDFFIGF